MTHRIILDTNIGTIRAVWDGGAKVSITQINHPEATLTLDLWDYENEKLLIEPNGRALARYVREFLWEMERGIEFTAIRVVESEELADLNSDW